MADIKPTSAVSPAVAAAAATIPAAAIEATIESSPDKIQQLLHQIQISATLTAPPSGTSLSLQTNLGNLTILLPTLAEGAQQKLIQQLLNLFQNERPLTLVIQPGEPPTQALIFLPQSSGSAAPTGTTTAALSQPSFIPLSSLPPGTQLTAVVLPPSLFPAANSQATLTSSGLPSPLVPPALVANEEPALARQATETPFPLQGGVPRSVIPLPSLALNNLPSALEANDLALTGNAASPSSTGATPPPVFNPLPSAPSPTSLGVSSSSVLQPGQEVIVTLNSASTVAAPAPINVSATTSLNANETLVATVIGKGPSGQLILQTSDATLFIRQPTNAAIGSTLLITIENARAPTPSILTSSDTPNLSSLQSLLASLNQIDPLLAQRFTDTALPQPTSQLSSGLLFFLSALKQGDTRSWLGETVTDVLTRAGKLELISNLEHQLSSGSQMVRDEVVGEWRAYTVPLHAEEQLQSFNLYVHNDSQSEHRRNTGGSDMSQMRFLIDVRMTRLGPLQLDGLVQPKKLDMIVRSESALPTALPQSLRDTFIQTLDAIGYTGGLSFQSGRQHWLTMKRQGSSREA